MPMILPLLTLPNPKLRERSKEVNLDELKEPEFQAWLDDLIKTMREADGVGIAAPQVGRQVRVFVAMDQASMHVVVNPVAVGKSWRTAEGEEGCLSVPGKYGIVRRHRGFKISCYDRQGRKVMLSGKDFFARVLQHELDHLDGVLYVDRAKEVFNVNL